MYLQSPLVLRPRSLNRETLLNILRYYLETSLWGSTSTALTFYCICFYRWLLLKFLIFEIIQKFLLVKYLSNQRRLFGRYYLLSASFLPAYTAFQLSWFYPIRTVRLFGTATTQAVRCLQKKKTLLIFRRWSEGAALGLILSKSSSIRWLATE